MKILLIYLILAFTLIAGNQNNSDSKNITPQRIVLNVSDSLTTRIGITWMTLNNVSEAEVQIARTAVWKQFLDSVETFRAESAEFITDNFEKIFNHSLLLTNLQPDTKYLYRVGGESVWSEWFQFKTAENSSSPFEFTYFGDAQNQYKQFVPRVFREAFKKSPDSEFWLISGDLVSEPTEKQISELFYAGSPFFSFVPLAAVPGNHDRDYRKANGEFVRNGEGRKIRSDSLAAYWRSSFTLPENGISSLKESSYYFDYQGVRFIMMNSNLMLEEQSEWLESTLQQNLNKWSVVSFHHPIYSAGSDRDDDRSRNAFMKVFDKYNVDLVLTGHDHAYARSHKLKNGERVEDDEVGTVYVVSVSGPKMYSVNSKYEEIMAKTGGYAQLFQVIRFEGNKLSYKAYTADGEIYDSFELMKD